MAHTMVPRVNVAGAVYGQVLATSLVVGVSYDSSLGPGTILEAVALSMLIFWLAHVYAQLMAQGAVRGREMTWRAVPRVMGEEWPVAQAVLPAVIALGLGALGVYSRATAVTLAIVLGIADLFGWGLVVGRRAGLAGWGLFAVALVDGLLGLGIVALKVFVA